MGQVLGLTSITLANDGITLTGTITGSTGSGITPTTGVANFSLLVDGVVRQFQSSATSGTAWTAIAYTPIKATSTVQVVAVNGSGAIAGTGMAYLGDSGSNTATASTYSVTNNSTKTQADAVAAQKSIPSGWLTSWATIRALHASQLIELSFVGDSTAYGAGSSGEIGWPYKTRQALVNAGYGNGGQGLIYLSFGSAGESNGWQGYVENQNPFSGASWPGGDNTYGPGVVGASGSNTPSQSMILQGRGTRIRIYYSQFVNIGDFTWSVDSGLVNTVTTGYDPTSPDTGVVDIAGLADALHAITITNIGSRAQPLPVFNGNQSQGSPSSGTLGAGNYQYAITALDNTNGVGNETLAAYSNTFAVDAALRSVSLSILNSYLTAQIGNTAKSYNIYRSINGGAFGLLGYTNISGSFASYNDTGSVSPGAQNPPTVPTFTRDTYPDNTTIGIEFIRSTGIVCHKDAVTGATFATFGLDGSAYNNFWNQIPLGLNHTQPATGKASQPPWRTVSVAVCALGINNQQSGQTDTTLVSNGLTNFLAAANLAAALPVIIIPHYSRSASWTTAKPFIDLVKTFCAGNNVPWIDFNAVLDISNFGDSGGNPHIGQTGYDAEGQFVFDGLLGVTVSGGGGNAIGGGISQGSRLMIGGGVRF